jgi:7-cyano-7-deazaguanine synthase in queuosine biosynthesis
MRWQVLVHVGDDDAFALTPSPTAPRLRFALERPGDPEAIGNDVLRVFADGPTLPRPRAIDLANLAMSVYAADLRVSRDWTEDRWTREFALHLAMREPGAWHSDVKRVTTEMLRFLTGDDWGIELRTRDPAKDPPPKTGRPYTFEVVCLFSGGLDSLVGAINLLEEGRRVALVAHHGAGMTKSFQDRILDILREEYPGQILPFLFYVQPKKDGRKGEASMRSRSLLFLSLGVAVASALESPVPLVVSENGLISLNVPLTAARIGSAATRTTHPHFISQYRTLISALSLPVPIELPARFQTKGEMLASVRNRSVLEKTAPFSMSCARSEDARFRGVTPGTHCGYCTPCIIRRAALQAAGLSQDRRYVKDIKRERLPKNSATREDLRAFLMALERTRGTDHTQALFSVLSTGPLEPEDAPKYASVYERGMAEVRLFLESTKH